MSDLTFIRALQDAAPLYQDLPVWKSNPYAVIAAVALCISCCALVFCGSIAIGFGLVNLGFGTIVVGVVFFVAATWVQPM